MMGKVVLALALIAVCASADFSDEYVPETELAEHHVGLKLHKHVGLTIKHKPSAAPVVYQHCNFGGYKKVLRHSTNWVRKLGIKNDDLSSIKVPAGKCVVLYQHAHYRGKAWKICGKKSIKCFVHHKMLGGKTWNDQVSSIKVLSAKASKRVIHHGIVKKNLKKDHKKAKAKAKADHKKLIKKVVSAHSTRWANHKAHKLTRSSKVAAATYSILKRAERAHFSKCRHLARVAGRAARGARRALYKNHRKLISYKFKTFWALKKLQTSAKKMLARKAKFSKKMKKVQADVKKAQKKAKKHQAKKAKAHKKTMKRLARFKKYLKAKAAKINKRWAQAQAAIARRNKRANKRYAKVVKSLKKRNKLATMKFNARVARGKAYFAKRVKSNKKRAAFRVFQLRAKQRIVKLAAKLAAAREARYNKREARNKRRMKNRELKQKKHAKKVLKMNRRKESVAKAAKAARAKARYQKQQEKAAKMKKKADAAKKKAAEAAAAAAAASKADLSKDAAMKSCPFTGPEMCQDKKKNYKCVKTHPKKGPWMGSDFVTCSFKKPKAPAADAGLAWAGFNTFSGFKETKFSMPAFSMPAMPKF